jgi:hypothetical protein
MHPAAVHEEVRRLAAAGVNDCEIARRTGLPRTTVRDIRRARGPRPRATCPRCWRPARPIRFTPGEYAELLGLYLGDGCISEGPRTQRLRLALDARHAQIVDDAIALLARCFGANSVGVTFADGGATAVVSVYSSHLACLFPQHGAGKKHDRRILLEPWQESLVDAAPWAFLRGCIHSDGCFYINRTGRYRYLSVEFHNRSSDVLDLVAHACDTVSVRYRRYAKDLRVYDRASVRELAAFVGCKR